MYGEKAKQANNAIKKKNMCFEASEQNQQQQPKSERASSRYREFERPEARQQSSGA